MASPAKSKQIAKEIRRRGRSYSNGDANALSKCTETNVFDLSRDWLAGSDVKAGSPLKRMTQVNTSLGLMVLESIMRKYELEKSDFDALKDMGLVADKHVEFEDLCNLALYAWNLEETLLEEETTDSLDEYFALLEQCYQKRSRRPRSNTTGSYPLTSKNNESFGDKFNENIEGAAEKSIKRDLKRGAVENSKTNVHGNIDLQIVITHGDRQDGEDPERANPTPREVQEVTIEQQRNGQWNSADWSSQESIQSDKSNRESKSIQSDVGNNKSFESSSVSLTTTVWSSDHTYCLTCSPTKPEEYREKSVAMVIPNKGKVGQAETSDTRYTDKTRDVPNKEDTKSDTSPSNVKAARDANIPYKEIPIKTGSDGIEELLSGRQDGDAPCDISYKAARKKNDRRTSGSKEATSRGVDIPCNNSSIESRDPDKPCDNTQNMKNAHGKNNRVNSEESQSDMNETPETPKKKTRKAADNSEGAGKTRSRDTPKPRDSTQPRDHSQSQDSTKSRDSIHANGSTQSPDSSQEHQSSRSRDSIRPRDSLQSPPPKSDQSSTPSPVRRSMRTRQPTPRRLDTYYY